MNTPSKPSATKIAFALVTSLFFMWGLAYGLLDVLNKHFQELLGVTKSRSTLLQAAYFGAYFIIAYPAGIFMNRFGYKRGIILGLLLYAIGAFLFYPAAQALSFNFFLFALFVIACGLACLETAANPYVTVLGSPEGSEFRLNLSQSFNGIGSFLGPLIGAKLFFVAEGKTSDLSSVQYVYLLMAGLVLMILVLFLRTPLPEIREEEVEAGHVVDLPLEKQNHFVSGVITQFFYIAAQVGSAALFINYCTEAVASMRPSTAAILLSVCLMLFTAGRFVGTALMSRVAPPKLLFVYAVINIALCAVVIPGRGYWGIGALMAVFFFMSIMFATIFALAVKDLGAQTKKGSSFVVMAIAGGTVGPYAMGLIAEHGTSYAYIVPLLCFILVAWFGYKGYRVRAAPAVI